MKLRALKPIRVVSAVTFLMLTAFLFLDFREAGAKGIAKTVLFLQFVPSLMSFLEDAAIGATGFVVVLALTALFGRVYCSTLCPLGTLQDVISRIANIRRLRHGRKKSKYGFTKQHSAIRYTILAATVFLFLGGSGLLLNLLDPFSIFGRILSNLVRPVILAMNNAAVTLLEYFGIHALYRVQWPAIAPLSIAVALLTLFTVGWLSARHGRLYCNTLCPVGTLLGIISKNSLLRIQLDNESCSNCKKCEQTCKSGCIDFKEKSIDFSRCVYCCNCLSVCPDGAMKITTALRSSTNKNRLSSRRKFMSGLVAGGISMVATGSIAAGPPPVIPARPTTIPEGRTGPISPPGSLTIKHFTSKCTACHLCVSSCPSRVLLPSTLDYGLSGIMQPQMSFQSGHCNYDCTTCSEVCPTGAILQLTSEQKKTTQVGIAKFIKKNCVVYTDNTNCGACSEHCPTKAVHMVPYQTAGSRKLVIPEVNESICIGCGGCEHACPTKPFKAIYVDGNPIHKTAKKPVETKLQRIDETEDFPF